MKIFSPLYDRALRWSRHPHAERYLAGVSFTESSFFPIPPDVLLIAMVVSNRSRWLRDAAICTLGSVTGALFGYFIGWGLYESAGRWIASPRRLRMLYSQSRAYFRKTPNACSRQSTSPWRPSRKPSWRT